MIRAGTPKDAKGLTKLVENFYQEAPYEAPPVHHEQAGFVFEKFAHAQEIDAIQHFLYVIEVQGKIVGAICAERIPDLWSEAEKIVEHFIYVLPKYRGTIHPGKLLLKFGKWTKERPAVVRVEASGGLEDEKVAVVFERLGWERRGILFGSEAY